MFKRQPVFVFKDEQSKGIDIVPLSGLCLVKDNNSNGPFTFLKASDDNLDSNTTIQDFLNTSSNYVQIIDLSNYVQKSDSIDVLSDVDISNASQNQIFKFDGTKWTNNEDLGEKIYYQRPLFLKGLFGQI